MLIIKYILGLVLYFCHFLERKLTAKHLTIVMLFIHIDNFSHYPPDRKHIINNTIIANPSAKIVDIPVHHKDLIIISWKLKNNMTLK